MTKEITKDQPRKEDIVKLVNIVKQMNSTSFALMQNNANVLLARDKLENQTRKPPQKLA